MFEFFKKYIPGIKNNTTVVECHHIFFPKMVDGTPTGQQCSICGKFNSLKDLGIKLQK